MRFSIPAVQALDRTFTRLSFFSEGLANRDYAYGEIITQDDT